MIPEMLSSIQGVGKSNLIQAKFMRMLSDNCSFIYSRLFRVHRFQEQVPHKKPQASR